jgi:hypothetical protein
MGTHFSYPRAGLCVTHTYISLLRPSPCGTISLLPGSCSLSQSHPQLCRQVRAGISILNSGYHERSDRDVQGRWGRRQRDESVSSSAAPPSDASKTAIALLLWHAKHARKRGSSRRAAGAVGLCDAHRNRRDSMCVGVGGHGYFQCLPIYPVVALVDMEFP